MLSAKYNKTSIVALTIRRQYAPLHPKDIEKLFEPIRQLDRKIQHGESPEEMIVIDNDDENSKEQLEEARENNSPVPYKPKETRELQETIKDLKEGCFSRKLQLRRQILESEEELKVIIRDWEEASVQAEESHVMRDAWKAEYEFTKYKNFWKRVHRKHIMEDLNDLKKHQKDCFKSCEEIVSNFVLRVNETPTDENFSLWKRTKKLFSGLWQRTTGARQRRERRNNRLKELIKDFESGIKMVDELEVQDHCSYFRKPGRIED